MPIKEAIEEIINSFSQSAFIKFQALMRNQVLNLQEIKLIQNVFTMLLKEKEKENCEFLLESIQVFVQKYNSKLFDWLYILLVQLIKRQSVATSDNHIRALQDTTDMLRNLFSHQLLLQLCCKFVMDNIQARESTIKIHLLKFIRLLVVSIKPNILNNIFPDLVMAISRIISWTVDIKSMKVRKESEIVIHKFFNLNPNQFFNMIKSLPIGFQERTKMILKDNLTFGSFYDKQSTNTGSTETIAMDTIAQNESSITLATNESVYPRPGLFEMSNLNSQSRYMSNTNHNIRAENSGTVTYNNTYEKANEVKLMDKKVIHSSGDRRKSFKHSQKNKKIKTFDTLDNRNNDVNEIYNSDDSLFLHESRPRRSKKSKNRMKNSTFDLKTPSVEEDEKVSIKNIIQELSRYNERHQERKLSLIALIKSIHSNNQICWDTNFKIIMSILLKTLGDNEGGTRKLAILSIQELAKVEPQRFQDQILLIINKLLLCFNDTDRGVIEAIKSCVIIFSQYLNVDTLWRTLNIIIVENENGMQSSGLKFMQYVINSSSPVIVSSLLIETLSLLNKLTIHKDMKNRKNSVYCLIAIYKKIGDKIWPNLKSFDKNKIRLLQIYIHRLK